VNNLPPGDYMDIKLFYPDYYCGFSSGKDIAGLIIFAMSAAALLTYLVWKYILPRSFQVRLILVATYLYLVAVCVIVPLIVEKQNIMWCWKFGITPFDGTGFTNAVAYPFSKLDFVASKLEARFNEKPVDLLLDTVASENKFKRYIVVPNLFQHIGIYSSNAWKNQGNDRYLKTSMSFTEE